MKQQLKVGISNLVDDLCNVSVNRLPQLILSKEDRNLLVWDMIDKVLNSNIGAIVKSYQSNILSRVLDYDIIFVIDS